MFLSDILKKVCEDLNVSAAELARRSDQTPQNLSKKIRNGTLDFDEFIRLLNILGVRYDHSLTYPNGEMPDTPLENARVREKIAMLEAQVEFSEKRVEYLVGLIRDIRTSMNTINGCTTLAMKHLGDNARTEDLLQKILYANGEIASILMETRSFNERNPRLSPAEENAVKLAEDVEILRGKRVLLVEDNQMNREITRDILVENGLVVEESEDGLAAVNRIKNEGAQSFDCVLMDVQMPTMDGHEASRLIRKLPNGEALPIIALSANAFEGDRQKCLEAGMNAFISKPLVISELLAAMCQVIRKD